MRAAAAQASGRSAAATTSASTRNSNVYGRKGYFSIISTSALRHLVTREEKMKGVIQNT
jgi:hypothetical protein